MTEFSLFLFLLVVIVYFTKIKNWVILRLYFFNLGGYDKEEKAAGAYDLAALKS